MPPKSLQTVQDLSYWEYAKLIARTAGFQKSYGFITLHYKKLNSTALSGSKE
jgi:hypothetical protein